MSVLRHSVHTGLIIVGVTSRYFDSIDASASIELPLSVFAASAGLHSLRGLRLLDASNKKQLFSPETEIGKVFITEDDPIVSDEQPDLASSPPSLPPNPVIMPAVVMAEEVQVSATSFVSGYYPIESETAAMAEAVIAAEDAESLPVYAVVSAHFDTAPGPGVGTGADMEAERVSLAAVPEADAEQAEAALVEAAEMQEVGVEGVSEDEPPQHHREGVLELGEGTLTYPEAVTIAGVSSPFVGRGLAEELSSELLASASSQEGEDGPPSFSGSGSAEDDDDDAAE